MTSRLANRILRKRSIAVAALLLVGISPGSTAAETVAPSSKIFVFLPREQLPPSTRTLFVGLANPVDQALHTPLRWVLSRRVGRRWVSLGRIEPCQSPGPACSTTRLLPASQGKNEPWLPVITPLVPAHSVAATTFKLLNWRPGRYRIDANYFLPASVSYDIQGAEFEIRTGAPENPSPNGRIGVRPFLIEQNATATVTLSRYGPAPVQPAAPDQHYDICRFTTPNCELVGGVSADSTGLTVTVHPLPSGFYGLHSGDGDVGLFAVARNPVGRVDSLESNGAFAHRTAISVP